MKLLSKILIILSIMANACASPEAQTMDSAASGNESESKNALVIQADFGGLAMSGVAYTVSKDLDFFSLPQLIPLYDIRAASNGLAYNSATWPSGTVFVSVVDPGVGTARKSVVLKTKNGQYFVSPDNGSLSGPAEKYGIEAVREIDETVNRREGTEWSHTFHGRDVYTYTGARLAAGVISYEEVGPLLEAKVILLEEPVATLENDVLKGVVTGGIGRLGNVELSIDRHLFSQINASYGDIFSITYKKNGKVIWQGSIPYTKSFGDVAVGEPLLFVNSGGYMSTAINQGHFASTYGVEVGNDWTVELKKE